MLHLSTGHHHLAKMTYKIKFHTSQKEIIIFMLYFALEEYNILSERDWI